MYKSYDKLSMQKRKTYCLCYLSRFLYTYELLKSFSLRVCKVFSDFNIIIIFLTI